MIVKIGDVEYDSNFDPIMVILSDEERASVAAVLLSEGRYWHCPVRCTRYLLGISPQWIDAWVNDKPFDCTICDSITWPRCSDCCDTCYTQHGEYYGEESRCVECKIDPHRIVERKNHAQ